MINDLKFSGELPVVVNKYGSSADIFAPIRTSSCDVNIVSDKILDDLYTSEKDGVKMKIERDIYETEINIVHHDAIYETVHHPAEYETIHHPAEYETIHHLDQEVRLNYDFDLVLADGTVIANPQMFKPGTIDISDTYAYNQIFTDVDGALCYKGRIDINGQPRTIFAVFNKETWRWEENNKWSLPDVDYCIYLAFNNDSLLLRDGECYIFHNGSWILDDFGASKYVRFKPPYYGEQKMYTSDGSKMVQILLSGENEHTPNYFQLWKTLPDSTYVNVQISKYIKVDNVKQSFSHLFLGVIKDKDDLSTKYAFAIDNYTDSSKMALLDFIGFDNDVPTNPIFRTNKSFDIHDSTISYDLHFYLNDDSGDMYVHNDVNEYYRLRLTNFAGAIVGAESKLLSDGGTYPYTFQYTPTWILRGNDGKTHFYSYNATRTLIVGEPWDEEVMVKPAWDEEVMVKPAWDEEVMVKPAWDEKIFVRKFVETVPLWEGYQTPNTFTQRLSQNLDEISLTCIDPIALLKYVHIDNIMTKPNVVDYKTLIGKALAYVKLDGDMLYVEECVKYDGVESLLDMRVQVSNFWDEAGEPATLYNMFEEMLRPFGMSIFYDGNNYYIHSHIGSGTFRKYKITSSGNLAYQGDETIARETFRERADWKSNNVDATSMSINETYDKVTGIASTNMPVFSTMAMDLIDPEDKDKYDAQQLNIQRNKIKGYDSAYQDPDFNEKDYWYYLWNGVYINELYGLELHNNGGVVDGWDNINKAFKYLSELDGRPDEWGSCLNFYGGVNNPTGTGKEQRDERSVDVKKRITAFAPDNGIPPEFMDKDDFKWYYKLNYDYDGAQTYIWDPSLKKVDKSDTGKWGVPKSESLSSTITYHQEYPNMTLMLGSEQTLDLALSQSYSRTGIDVPISLMQTSYIDSPMFRMMPLDDTNYYQAIPEEPNTSSEGCYAYTMPHTWLSENVSVNSAYFNAFTTTNGMRYIWDKRRVDVYVRLEDGTIYQFNGKEWIMDTAVKAENAFYLKKLMNDEKLFNNDFQYNVIECADGEMFALDEEFSYNYDVEDGHQYKPNSGKGRNTETVRYYLNEGNEWTKYVDDCNAGNISIVLPDIAAINASIFTDVYNSNMLGMTGMNTPGKGEFFVSYKVTGQGKVYDPETGDYNIVTLSPNNVGEDYGRVHNINASYDMIPYSATYVKAEHLDLSIEVSVPKSNLGKVFGESDIKYTIDTRKNYLEQFEGPTFKVNTSHPLVASSFSYLIKGASIASPESFEINGVVARPESYVVQMYKNYLSRIRRIYNKTMLVLSDKKFDNAFSYITTMEMGGERTLKVVADIYDLKTLRHTVEAVESDDMDVTRIETISATEIPHKARNERWNLPSVKK